MQVVDISAPLSRFARACGVVGLLAVGMGCGASSVQPSAAPKVVTTAAGPGQRYAELGRCQLESGQRIEACRLGYRTFGTLNAAKDNAVLVPTWFTGTSKDLAALVPDRFVDTRRFYLVLVDALANGVSSSPSNSTAQPRLQFPRISVRDMVAAEHRLVHETLGLTRLHAVVGISMGGMQALQWAVSYPEEMTHVVSMVGTPKLSPSDVAFWTTELHAIVDDVGYRGGDYQGQPRLRAAIDLLEISLFSPAYRNVRWQTEQVPSELAKAHAGASMDWNDRRRQVEAMLAHDVGAGHDSLEAAAARVRARALLLVATQDRVVDPAPAQAFAKSLGATLEVSASECGHLAVQGCETDAVAAKVAAFLTSSESSESKHNSATSKQ